MGRKRKAPDPAKAFRKRRARSGAILPSGTLTDFSFPAEIVAAQEEGRGGSEEQNLGHPSASVSPSNALDITAQAALPPPPPPQPAGSAANGSHGYPPPPPHLAESAPAGSRELLDSSSPSEREADSTEEVAGDAEHRTNASPHYDEYDEDFNHLDEGILGASHTHSAPEPEPAQQAEVGGPSLASAQDPQEPEDRGAGSGEGRPRVSIQITNSMKLFSLLVTTGSNRMRTADYDTLRKVSSFLVSMTRQDALPRWASRSSPPAAHFVQAAGEDSEPSFAVEVFPSMRTIQRQLAQMLGVLTGRPTVLRISVDASKPGGRVTARQGRRSQKRAAAQGRSDELGRLCDDDEAGGSAEMGSSAAIEVVLPSEYALLDVATAPIYDAMQQGAAELDAVPLIKQERDGVHGTRRLLGLDTDRAVGPLSVPSTFWPRKAAAGDSIFLEVDARGGRPREPWMRFVRSGNPDVRPGSLWTLAGRVVAVFHVDGAPSWAIACRQMLARGGLEDSTLGCQLGEVEPQGPAGSGPECAEETGIEIFDGRATVDFSKEATAADIRLAKLLSVASHGHVRRGGGRLACDDPRALNTAEPLRPGDVVSLVSPLSSPSATAEKSRLAVICRWWPLDGEPQRLVSIIPDVESALIACKSAVEAGAGKAGKCPYLGASTGAGAIIFGQPFGELPAGQNSGRVGGRRDPDTGVPRMVPYGPHGPVSSVVIKDYDSLRAPSPSLAPTAGRLGHPNGGRPYVIYRFCLYHDGFRVTEGKSASAEGIYMLPLNLPRQLRRGSPAVRVLSVTPPGSNVLEVFDAILNNVLKGATHGFPAVAPDGTTVQVYLDLVAWIADTPAGNQLLDTRGHTATAPCHLCSFSIPEKSSQRGRYIGTHASGGLTRYSRTLAGHRAIRDTFPATGTGASGQAVTASSATYQRGSRPGRRRCPLGRVLGALGLKDTETAPRGMLHMPLHAFSLKLRAAADRGDMAVDSHGSRLLSGEFDPYRAVAVAPDHLLTGHFRSTVEAVLRMMTPAQRSASNAFLLDHLQRTGLDAQGDIVNVEKSALHTMAMQETYALACVAEPALLAGALAPEEPVYAAGAGDSGGEGSGAGAGFTNDRIAPGQAELSRKSRLLAPEVTRLRAALGVVASAAELIARFWTPREVILASYHAGKSSAPAAGSREGSSLPALRQPTPSPGLCDDSGGPAGDLEGHSQAALQEHGRRFAEDVRLHLSALERLFSSRGADSDPPADRRTEADNLRPPRGPTGQARGTVLLPLSARARRTRRGARGTGSDGEVSQASHQQRSASGGSDSVRPTRARHVEEAEKARQAADKPNVHRLLELADVFLTDFLHGDFIAEMPFEATHQPLKRAIERSNWHEPHRVAVKAALMNDWEGRMAALQHGARRGSEEHIRGCVRLLLGEHALKRCAELASLDEARGRVLSALGPGHGDLVAEHLRNSKRRVFSEPVAESSTALPQPGFWAPTGLVANGVQCAAAGASTAPLALSVNLSQIAGSSRVRLLRQRVFLSAEWDATMARTHSPPGRRRAARLRYPTKFSQGDIVGVRLGSVNPNEQLPTLIPDANSGTLSAWCVVGVCAGELPAESIDLILRPCEDAAFDVEGYHPRPKRVATDPEVLPHLLKVTAASMDAFEPLAVIPDCASLLSPSSCGVKPPRHSGPWLVTHRDDCEPMRGGLFYIRDRASGFPPRSA